MYNENEPVGTTLLNNLPVTNVNMCMYVCVRVWVCVCVYVCSLFFFCSCMRKYSEFRSISLEFSLFAVRKEKKGKKKKKKIKTWKIRVHRDWRMS